MIFKRIFVQKEFDKLNNIIRWAGHSTIKQETVAHHTHFVTMAARLLLEELFPYEDSTHVAHFKLQVVTYACFHDFDEVITGDIGHTVKYNDSYGEEMRKILKNIIEDWTLNNMRKDIPSERLLGDLLMGNVTYSTKAIVKVCDWFSMLLYLKNEINLGNKNFTNEFNYCRLKMMASIEVCESTLVNEVLHMQPKLQILEELKLYLNTL